MEGFGPPSRASFAEAPMPPCEEKDVLVEVRAAGVNPVDWKECAGYRQAFYGGYPDRWIPGYDGAGVVRQVGSAVARVRPGDRVVVFSDRRENGHNGTFAEY